MIHFKRKKDVGVLLSKRHLLPVAGSTCLNTSAHCVSVSVSPRKTQCSTARDGACFSYREERQRKASFSRGSPGPLGPSQQPTQVMGVHVPIVCYSRRTVSSPCRGQAYEWGWPGVRWHTCLSRKRAHTLSLQGQAIPYKEINLGQAVKTLSLGKEVPQARVPSSCGREALEDISRWAPFWPRPDTEGGGSCTSGQTVQGNFQLPIHHDIAVE